MKKRFYFLFIVIGVVAMLSVGTYANFQLKSGNITKSYSAGDIIKGKVNISFDEENADSWLTSNFNGSIKLLDFLQSFSG